MDIPEAIKVLAQAGAVFCLPPDSKRSLTLDQVQERIGFKPESVVTSRFANSVICTSSRIAGAALVAASTVASGAFPSGTWMRSNDGSGSSSTNE